MKWLEYFIKRPITAIIINLMLMFLGLLALPQLLIDEYPRIVVPKIKIETAYYNASAATVEKEITDLIEEAMSKVMGVQSISSHSSAGLSEVKIKFLETVSMDQAFMQVSEQLSRIAPHLPAEADNPAIKRSTSDSGAFLYLGVMSKELSGSALTHMAFTKIRNYFQAIDGVASVDVYGAPYLVNITLDTLAMHNAKIGPHDVSKVLKEHELLLQAGQMPSTESINLNSLAKKPEDYAKMIIKVNHDLPIRLGDIARIELSDDDKSSKIRVNGQNAILIAITKAPDANSLALTKDIYHMVNKINQELDGSALLSIESDNSLFIRASLSGISKTIAEACILVILIIFLFLRQLKATLVPMVTIPISLIATFLALKFFGLSINTITLLAMVLAVGLVVDDAIVVLENIFRFREQGFSPLDAAIKGSQEIALAIIAMTITLMSVFLPLAFVNNMTGIILREFAITLSCAVFFSGIVALTLSPMMCAYLLKRHHNHHKYAHMIENAITKIELYYARLLPLVLHHRRIVFMLMFIMLSAGLYLYQKLPKDLLPKEDRGLMGAFIPTIAGHDLDDMEPYVALVEDIWLKHNDVDHIITMGFSRGMNVIAILKPYKDRANHAEKILAKIKEEVSHIASADIYPWSLDSGLEILQDDSHDNAQVVIALKSTGSYQDLYNIAQNLVAAINQDQVLVNARADLEINKNAYSIKPLQKEMSYLGIDEKMISLSLQTFSYRARVSEFKLEGQRYKVYLQPDIISDDLNSIYVVPKNGDPVPLLTIAKVSKEVEAPTLKHLDKMRVAHVLASLQQGQSLSEAKTYLDSIIKKHSQGVSVAFQGMMAEQNKANNTFLLLFFAGLVFIFAIMAIWFESLIDPIIILVTVPFALIGGVIAIWLSNSSINLYTQVGFLTLIGLITKHGILLTAFISQQQKLGIPLTEAIFKGCSLRFRPIIMTTAATILGALPLILSKGAGVEARSSIGLVIIGGMIVGTVLTLFVLPSAIFSIHTLKNRLLKG